MLLLFNAKKYLKYSYGIFIIYIPEERGIRQNITRNDDIFRGHSSRKISYHPPTGRYINALLYWGQLFKAGLALTLG